MSQNIYPLKTSKKENVIDRDHCEFELCARTGTEKHPIKGLKGYSVLNDILDFPDACPFDYMHLLYEGIIILAILIYV